MSNEDMLEIADRLLRTRSTDALALVQTVEALAAEVSELRKDRERLEGRLRYVRDWLKHAANSDGGIVSDIDLLLDVAMKERSDGVS